MPLFKNKNKPAAPIPLQQIIDEVKNTIIRHQEAFLKKQEEKINQYFTDDGKPKTKIIKLSDNKQLKAPIISLTKYSIYEMQSITFDFEVRLSPQDKRKLKEEKNKAAKEGIYINYTKSSQFNGMVKISINYCKQ